MQYIMLSTRTILWTALGLVTSISARKTSIYIDQIPQYSKLPPCAENRLSAIVRAQSSGCGDNQGLTSFSCFCLDQSTMMASIISKDVQSMCEATMTANGPVSLVTPLPQVMEAIDVFNSYCERKTELSLYQEKTSTDGLSAVTVTATPTPSPTSTIASSTSPPTQAPQTPQPPQAPPPNQKTVPIAAIIAPVTVAVVAIAAAIALFFWRRRRRSPPEYDQPQLFEVPNNAIPYIPSKKNEPAFQVTPMGHGHDVQTQHSEWHGGGQGVWRNASNERFKLENKETAEPVELDSGGNVEFKKSEKNEKGGWMTRRENGAGEKK
ncbi:unnamed protein product [Periconia digitata]|uniref:Extracellular membrane protein CFEM domain-containing protein n=1 Tax=Periconia digitata TaxID=1303443 RepID=A0A9W4UQ03_9PLEO|nr:unnamed protein product [Periconia digitata]